MKRAVILFTRAPEPGKTKTRMMPWFTPKQCARLHTCFLEDIRRACEDCQADIFISYTPETGKARLEQILGQDKVYFPQQGEDLGSRMYHAMEEVLGRGYEACLLTGTDVPELSGEDLEKGFQVLESADVVFGKTRDGGYYLVGMKQPLKEAFGLKTYGHGKVLEETLEDLEKAGFRTGFGTELSDMDIPEDLRGYRRRMRKNPALKKTSTGRFLAANCRISVIIPVYNEEKLVEKLQQELAPLEGRCEILFVDGGSTDKTVEKIAPRFRVLHTEKGRALQMNQGARESTGDVLFFLHCDSELPDHPLERIRKVMRDYEAGCFGVAFHSRNFFMFTCRVISNHRIRDRKVMFGDQGIFVDRELFFEAGMFPEIPVMEDYQFSLTLKEMGVKLGMADRRIYTSDRRFPGGTIPKLQLMWKMNRMRKMYRDGVSPEILERLYQDVR